VQQDGGLSESATTPARIDRYGGNLKMATGTVKWFDAKRRCGIIIPDDPAQHECEASASQCLEAGARVEYRPESDCRGWRAEDVRLLQPVPTRPRSLFSIHFNGSVL
jgi:cold shock CspA family protein